MIYRNRLTTSVLLLLLAFGPVSAFAAEPFYYDPNHLVPDTETVGHYVKTTFGWEENWPRSRFVVDHKFYLLVYKHKCVFKNEPWFEAAPQRKDAAWIKINQAILHGKMVTIGSSGAVNLSDKEIPPKEEETETKGK